MIKILIFLFIALAGFLFIGGNLASFIYRIRSIKSKIRKDTPGFLAFLNEKASELTDWSHEEFELLSFNTQETKKRSAFHITREGFIENIYHELAFVFKYRCYNTDDNIVLLTAANSKNVFQLTSENNKVKAEINGSLIGYFTENGQLWASKDTLLKIDDNPGLSHFPITINGETVVALNNPFDGDNSNLRAFQLFKNTSEDQENFAILSMLHTLFFTPKA